MPRAVPTEELRAVERDLRKIPNIGPAMARDLIFLGVRRVEDLRARDPREMYQTLCAMTGAIHDPCVLDTFEAAVHYARTGEARPWWSFTPKRKARSR